MVTLPVVPQRSPGLARVLRGFALVILAVAAIGLLAACGGEEEGTPGTTPPLGTPTQPSPGLDPTPGLEPTPGLTPTPGTTPMPGMTPTPGLRPTPTAGPGTPVAEAVSIELGEDPTLGQFLVDGEGMTLYLFANDEPNVSNCSGGCATNWPPLTADGDPMAGEGVDTALLGTIQREDGSTQVTYNGWPLYYFAGDAAAGDTNGQGLNNVWYVVSPEGEAIQ